MSCPTVTRLNARLESVRLSIVSGRGIGLSPTSCGADVQVDVDKIGKDENVVGSRATTFRLCFLSPTNALLPKLTVSELKKQKAPR